MSRPNEHRIRVVCHVLPAADARLRKLVAVHGTLGRAIDALMGVSPAGRAAGAGVGPKRPATRRKKSNDAASATGDAEARIGGKP